MFDVFLFLLMILPIVAFVLFCATYNKIIALDQRCEQARHDIDIQLKYRHELIPNLVETVKGFVDHEDKALRAVVEARKTALYASSQDARLQAEAQLDRSVYQLLSVVESYPELKASEHFSAFRRELTDCEHKIAAAERFCNLAIREYNTVVSQFPGRKIAAMFRLHVRQFLDLTADRVFFEDAPQVKF